MFGIKGASQCEIGLPELPGFQPSLNRGQPIPLGQFVSHQSFQLNHVLCISRSRFSCKAIAKKRGNSISPARSFNSIGISGPADPISLHPFLTSA